MRCVDEIGSRVRHSVGELCLALIGRVVQLKPPVEHAYHVVRALLAQGLHRRDGVVGLPVGAHVVARRVYAELQPDLRRDYLRLTLRAVGEPGGIQRRERALQPRLAKVETVVVRRRHKVHAALGHDVGVGRRRAEVEHLSGAQLRVGKGALEVCQCVFIVLEILHGVRERVGVILAHGLWETHIAVFKLRGRP